MTSDLLKKQAALVPNRQRNLATGQKFSSKFWPELPTVSRRRRPKPRLAHLQ